MARSRVLRPAYSSDSVVRTDPPDSANPQGPGSGLKSRGALRQPLRAGDRLVVEAESVVFGGMALSRTPRGVVFTPFLLPGERAEIEIVGKKGGVAQGEVLSLLEASLDRVKPLCRHFGICGGCAYQHATYEEQLRLKRAQVVETLQRLGGIADPPLTGIEPSPKPFGYRNRITVHVARGVTGFHRRGSDLLTDIDRCPLAEDEVNAALEKLRAEKREAGHFTLRRPGVSRAFHQANDAVAAALRDWVAGRIEPGTPLVIDAYCGTGFFGHAAAPKAGRVIGIDRDLYNIEEAQRDAAPNEEYQCGAVEDLLWDLLGEMGGATLIVDPSRAGLSRSVREVLAGRPPKRLIYVSCDPATMARDLKAIEAAFHPREFRAFDMFPQTAEIEVAGVLERVKG